MPYIPKLSKEELRFFKKQEHDFYVQYGLKNKIALHKRVSQSLCTLCVNRLTGCVIGYKKNYKKAVSHYLKALIIDPEALKDCPATRTMLFKAILELNLL